MGEAQERNVPVHRVSQGSGIMLMTDAEISEMLDLGRKAGIEVNLFIGPRATFDIGAQAYTAAGKSLLALYQIEVDRDIEAATRAHERLMQRAGFRYRHPANRGQHARRRQLPSISSSRLP
jgi:hypothetical protein